MPKKPYTITRFGCKTCKQRKIRCDEALPTCGNCIKAGRSCKRAVDCPSSSAHCAIFTGPLTLFHFGPLGRHSIRHDEVAYLDTFRHKLVEDVAGTFSRPAWRRLILQSIHDESALCHLAVAYGALNHIQDRSQHHSSPRRTNMELVLRHYTKGISSMQRIINDKSHGRTNVVLLCALLCICFEIRYARPYMTLLHLSHSLKILSSTPLQADDDVVLAFTRLDILASVSLRHHTPVMDLDRFARIGNNGIDAHWKGEHEFTVLLGRLCLFIRTEVDHIRFDSKNRAIPLHVTTATQRFEKQLKDFRYAYLGHVLPDTKASLQMEPKRRLLWLKYLAAVILLRPCFSMEEEGFDSLLPEFSCIVALSETMAASGQPPFYERHELSLDIGVIHPLFKVATKCRSPQIRRKAIDLLGIAASLEAGWDAPAYKAYAERTMQMEEEGLLDITPTNLASLAPSIIPESRRIHTLEIWPKCETSSTVTFRKRPDGVGTDWVDVTETITW